MSGFNKEQRDKIISRLQERGVKLPCPRCGKNQFSILEGYFVQFINSEPKNIKIGGPSIPSIIVLCVNCGHINQHALGVLGLLPIESELSEKDSTNE